MNLSKVEKTLVGVCTALALCLGVHPAAHAMHIMEGYLSLPYCMMWGILCVPFLALGVLKIKHLVGEQPKCMPILAMCGAFVFVISSLKIPSVTGSCSHMTGTGLGAMLFGPCMVSVLGLIVLLFQAILLAHGGLTTIGANCFSMAIAGPILSYVLYRVGMKCKLNRRVTVFLAAALGDLFTYCVTSVQLGVAHPAEVGGVMASIAQFLGVFAFTQVPLAIIEGLLTVVIVIGLETYALPELRALSEVNHE